MARLRGPDLLLLRDGLIDRFGDDGAFELASDDVDLFAPRRYAAIAPVGENFEERVADVLRVLNRENRIETVLDFWESHTQNDLARMERIKTLRGRLVPGGEERDARDPEDWQIDETSRQDSLGESALAARTPPVIWAVLGSAATVVGLATADISPGGGVTDIFAIALGLLAFLILVGAVWVLLKPQRPRVRAFRRWEARIVPGVGLMLPVSLVIGVAATALLWNAYAVSYRAFALRLVEIIPPASEPTPYSRRKPDVRLTPAIGGSPRSWTFNLLSKAIESEEFEVSRTRDSVFHYRLPRDGVFDIQVCAEMPGGGWIVKASSLASTDPLPEKTIRIDGGEPVPSCEVMRENRRGFEPIVKDRQDLAPASVSPGAEPRGGSGPPAPIPPSVSLPPSVPLPPPVPLPDALGRVPRINAPARAPPTNDSMRQTSPPLPNFSVDGGLAGMLSQRSLGLPSLPSEDRRLADMARLKAGPLGWPTAPLLIDHKAFRLGYDADRRRPVYVGHIVFDGKPGIPACPGRREMGEPWRADERVPDHAQPRVADFRGSGFNRGTLVRRCDARLNGVDAVADSFLLSNVVPQYPANNQIDWLAIETYTTNASLSRPILVLSGPIYPGAHLGDRFTLTIGDGRVPVPRELFRVLIAFGPDDGSLEVQAFLSRNTDRERSAERVKAIDTQRTSVAEIERLLGFRLLPGLPDEKRAQVATDDWTDERFRRQ